MPRIPLSSISNGVLFSTTSFASPLNPAGVPVLTPGAALSYVIYAHGTTTPAAVFAAETGGTAQPTPYVTDSGGNLQGWIDPTTLPLDVVVSTVGGPETFVLANGSSGVVTLTLTAADATIVVGGTTSAPTVKVGSATVASIASAASAASAAQGTATAAATSAALAAQKSNNGSDFVDAGSTRVNLRVPALTPASCVATGNLALTGLQTIDGYTVVGGDLVLLAGQTTASQNGLWAPAAGAWARPTEMATTTALRARTCAIIQGTVHKGETWLLQTNAAITVDTTSQVWVNQLAAPVVAVSSDYASGLIPQRTQIAAGTEISDDFSLASAGVPVKSVSGHTYLINATHSSGVTVSGSSLIAVPGTGGQTATYVQVQTPTPANRVGCRTAFSSYTTSQGSLCIGMWNAQMDNDTATLPTDNPSHFVVGPVSWADGAFSGGTETVFASNFWGTPLTADGVTEYTVEHFIDRAGSTVFLFVSDQAGNVLLRESITNSLIGSIAGFFPFVEHFTAASTDSLPIIKAWWSGSENYAAVHSAKLLAAVPPRPSALSFAPSPALAYTAPTGASVDVDGVLIGVTLTSLLSTGGAITSLPVSALNGPIPLGGVVTLNDGAGHTQNWTLSVAAANAATALTVTSQTPNFAYPATTTTVSRTGNLALAFTPSGTKAIVRLRGFVKFFAGCDLYWTVRILGSTQGLARIIDMSARGGALQASVSAGASTIPLTSRLAPGLWTLDPTGANIEAVHILATPTGASSPFTATLSNPLQALHASGVGLVPTDFLLQDKLYAADLLITGLTPGGAVTLTWGHLATVSNAAILQADSANNSGCYMEAVSI